MLTKQQIEEYHEKGYLGLEHVLSAAEVEELRAVTDEFVEKSRQLTDHTGEFDLEPDHTPEFPKVRRLKKPHKIHQTYAKTLRHPAMLEIASALVGTYAMHSNGTKLNMKSEGIGSPVHWHQDWAFYPHTNDDLLAFGVAIDDMTRENGCLLVIPGSHKGRIYDHHLDGHFCGAVTEPDFDDSAAEAIEIKAGGISIHHVRTLHASLPNISAKPRRLLLQQYCAGDSIPLQSVAQVPLAWDEFVASFVQGEPTLDIRMENLPVRMPQPPALKGGSIYENQSVLKTSTFGKPASS
jgi:phytanoyl-CoA hydroxylase